MQRDAHAHNLAHRDGKQIIWHLYNEVDFARLIKDATAILAQR